MGASHFLLFPLPFYVAPSEPQNFTVVNVNSTAIMVSWQPPAMPNGVVTGYFVWYTENLTCNNSQVSTSSRAELAPTADTHTFTELEEDTVYVFYVSAETSAGEGEAAMVTGRTSEDGECVHVCRRVEWAGAQVIEMVSQINYSKLIFYLDTLATFLVLLDIPSWSPCP